MSIDPSQPGPAYPVKSPPPSPAKKTYCYYAKQPEKSESTRARTGVPALRIPREPSLRLPLEDSSIETRDLIVSEISQKTLFYQSVLGGARRAIMPASHNASFARRCFLSTLTDEGVAFKENPETRLGLDTIESLDLKDRCSDHASRRFLLFYGLLLALYNKKVVPGTCIKMPNCMTCFQGGAGSTIPLGGDEVSKMQGAHSAIVTRPVIGLDVYSKTKRAFHIINQTDNEGLKPYIEALKGIGFEQAAIDKLIKKIKESKLPPVKDKFWDVDFPGVSVIAPGSDFFQHLAATVALPPSVNAADALLENAIRDTEGGALDILNECFSGAISPKEGLIKFKDKIELFLKQYAKTNREKITAIQNTQLEILQFFRKVMEVFNAEATENPTAFLVEFYRSIANFKISLEDLDKFSGSTVSIGLKEELKRILIISDQVIQPLKQGVLKYIESIKESLTEHPYKKIEEYENLLQTLREDCIAGDLPDHLPDNVKNLEDADRWIRTEIRKIYDSEVFLFGKERAFDLLNILRKNIVELKPKLKEFAAGGILKKASAEVDQESKLIQLQQKLLIDFPNFAETLTTVSFLPQEERDALIEESKKRVLRDDELELLARRRELTESELLAEQQRINRDKHLVHVVHSNLPPEGSVLPGHSQDLVDDQKRVYFRVRIVPKDPEHPEGVSISFSPDTDRKNPELHRKLARILKASGFSPSLMVGSEVHGAIRI